MNVDFSHPNVPGTSGHAWHVSRCNANDSNNLYEEVREYTRRLCEVVGRVGGFVMCTQIGEMEGCKPELVRAWVEVTREFGIY